MSNIVELRGQLEDRRQKAHSIFEKGTENMTQEDVEQVRALNDEMTDLGKQIDSASSDQQDMDRIKASLEERAEVQHPGFQTSKKRDAKEGAGPKSIGEMFTEWPGFGPAPAGGQGPEAEFDGVDIKATLFQTSAGWAAPTVRSDRVVDYAVRANVLANLLPTINVSLPSYLYMEETTFTNSAAETGEGSSKPASALALTQRTENIRKIATYIPVTDEQLEDVPAARSYLDNRLGYMVAQRLDTQIVAGDGTGQNILGINHTGRSSVQQQAKSTDATPDAVYKAMTLIRTVAFSEPNAVVFHPTDWQDVRLLRTADGIYIWGSPADAGPERIWGLNVVQTTGMTLNTALVGDFNQAALLLRQGLTMKVGYVNDDLIKNQQTIVAEMRAAVAVFRPAAFCEVTGV